MKKLLIAVCATAAVAAPAFASSTQAQRQAHRQAVKTCQGLHRSMSRAEFKATYGRNGVAHCVKKETAENTAETQQAQQNAHDSAEKQCRTERSQDPAAFQTKYGDNKNGKNAFGKCVSKLASQKQQELQAQDNQQDQNQVNAARTCHKAHKDDATAFAQKWGTKRNAFGKCVSSTARHLDQQGQQQQS